MIGLYLNKFNKIKWHQKIKIACLIYFIIFGFICQSHGNNLCDQRLSDQYQLVYRHAQKNVELENRGIHSELLGIINSLPQAIHHSAFTVLITPIDEYFYYLLSLRDEIFKKIQQIIKNNKSNPYLDSLQNLLENLKISEERRRHLIAAFEKNKGIQTGVLLNRRRSDFPNPELSYLVSYLDELISSPRGYITELLVALEFSNTHYVSTHVGDFLNDYFGPAELNSIKKEMGSEFFEIIRELEIDVIYSSNDVLYLTEVKNSYAFANLNNKKFESSREKLLTRAKLLIDFISRSKKSFGNTQVRLHYIFTGPGVARSLVDDLLVLGIKVN